MSRRAAEREARQQFILDAARSLFLRNGIESTSMDAIAAASDYTRRTLYAYFKSRDDILLRVHVEDVRRRWSLQRQALAGANDCASRIRTWATALFAFWREHPHCMRMEQYWDYHGIDREKIGKETFRSFRRLNDDLVAGLRSLFGSGVDEGYLRPDLDLDRCISQFVTSVRSIAYRALSGGYSFAKIDADRYLDHYLDLFLRGVRNEKGRKRRMTR